MSTGEADFYEALAAIKGCSHIAIGAPQTLDGICQVCRTTITKLVLLRDAYREDRNHFK